MELQAQSSWALANLLQNCQSNCRRLLEAEGLDFIIEAMKSNPRSLNVQAKATRALARAAKFYSPACDSIRQLGGVDLVCRSTRPALELAVVLTADPLDGK